MFAAACYVRPATSTTALGVQYAQLARNPWVVFRGSTRVTTHQGIGVEHRLLTPAVSWCLGLRGEAIIITNLLVAGLLLWLVTIWFRRQTGDPASACLASAILGFSLVNLSTVYYGGYCDSTTYLIIIMMYWLRTRPGAFYALFLLGMLNHESILFLLPWFILITRGAYDRRERWLLGTMLGTLLVLGAYAGYHALLLNRATAGSMSDYLSPLAGDPLYWWRRSSPYQALGFLTVFKGLWVIPGVAVVALWRSRRWRELAAIALPVVCALAQFAVAFDSSRLFTLAFMSMVLALSYMFKENPFQFRRWATAAFLMNLLIPQIFTAAKTVVVMAPTIVRVVQRI